MKTAISKSLRSAIELLALGAPNTALAITPEALRAFGQAGDVIDTPFTVVEGRVNLDQEDALWTLAWAVAFEEAGQP